MPGAFFARYIGEICNILIMLFILNMDKTMFAISRNTPFNNTQGHNISAHSGTQPGYAAFNFIKKNILNVTGSNVVPPRINGAESRVDCWLNSSRCGQVQPISEKLMTVIILSDGEKFPKR